MMNLLIKICIFNFCFWGSCVNSGTSNVAPPTTLQPSGTNIATRFKTPAHFERKELDKTSFAYYLSHLQLKPNGTPVKYYNGQTKTANVYDAVVDMEIGNRDLQQCADAVMRLRAEYLFAQKKYDQISFNFVNGFRCDYSEWMKGNRIVAKGNQTTWKKTAEASNTYQSFRKYMDCVFMYASTLSLNKSLKPKNIKDIEIGDVFIIGGSPGHAVIVVDLAVNTSGEKMFLLAQSYMPAQDIQILKNPTNTSTSPWYSNKNLEKLNTPEWTFKATDLKGW